MPATTPGGYPYLLESDLPVDYPDHSLVLAQTIETKVGEHQGRDTGWRNIASLLANGYTGTARLRRTGHTCELSVGVTRAASVSATPVAVLPNAPAGFAPDPTYYLTRTHIYDPFVATVVANSVILSTPDPNNWLLAYMLPANCHIYQSFIWTTTAAWPTTLPGVPG